MVKARAVTVVNRESFILFVVNNVELILIAFGFAFYESSRLT